MTAFLSSIPADVTVAFADAQIGIDVAREKGLSPTARILSTSPALITAGAAEELGAFRTPQDNRAFCGAVKALSHEAFERLKNTSEHSDTALTVARSLLRSEIWSYKAALLREEDMQAPFITVELEAPNHPWLNGPWRRLMKEHPNYRGTVKVPLDRFEENLAEEEEMAGFFQRLSFEPLESILFRLIQRSERYRSPGNRPIVFVCGTNGLIKESAVALWRKGVRPVSIPQSLKVPKDKLEGLPSPRLPDIGDLVRTTFIDWAPASLVETIVQEITDDIKDSLQRFSGARDIWRDTFERHAGSGASSKPAAVILNQSPAPERDALFFEAKERGIPVCGVEHGTVMELTPAILDVHAELESSGVNLSYCFADRMVAMSRNNPYNKAEGFAVGASRELMRSAKRSNATPLPAPILYTTNQCYMGNMHRPVNFGISDRAAHQYEVDLFNEVFAKLPHRVLYKPYPAFRYIDPDPSVAAAHQIPNIDVFQGRVDLRYILHRTRIFVTSLGHSTFTWCLLSGKPVIFIEQPLQNPLWDDIRVLIAEAMPFVQVGDGDWHATLRSHLSKEIEVIEAEYAARQPARDALIHELLGRTDGKGGRRIADHLLGMMSA